MSCFDVLYFRIFRLQCFYFFALFAFDIFIFSHLSPSVFLFFRSFRLRYFHFLALFAFDIFIFSHLSPSVFSFSRTLRLRYFYFFALFAFDIYSFFRIFHRDIFIFPHFHLPIFFPTHIFNLQASFGLSLPHPANCQLEYKRKLRPEDLIKIKNTMTNKK